MIVQEIDGNIVGPNNRASRLFGVALSDVARPATALALVAIILFPLSLLLQPHAHIGGDYDNSFWMTGYIAQYFRFYHHPTNVFQTTTSLGIAFPVFYGVLFYRLAGLVAAFSDPDIGLRVLFFGAMAAEVLTVYRAARAMMAYRGVGLLLCLGVAFSTYQLTNLYNRGDQPEFFAVTLLTTALAAWFWSRATKTSLDLWLARSIMAASLTLMCGTHAITMALGGVTFFCVSIVTLLFDRQRSALITLGIASAAYLAGASILIVDYVMVVRQIHFSPGIYQFGFYLFPDRIDAPIARFSLFPLDPQTVLQGVVNVSTPYLEAPIDYALLLFAAGVLFVRRNILALVFVAMALVVALISVWPWFWEVSPAAFHFMQFPYRLTSYVNALSLCAALSVVWKLPAQTRQVAHSPLPWIAGTIALIACLIKLNHGASAFHAPDAFVGYTVLSPTMVPVHQNYTTNPQTGGAAPVHAVPPEIQMFAIGAPVPQHYRADRNGLVFTRILVFPWNEIIVDGKILPLARKLTWADSPYFGFRTNPGSQHIVQTTFLLPSVVDRSIRLAEYCFIFEMSAIVTLLVLLLLQHPSLVRRA